MGTGQIDRRWIDKHTKLLVGTGDLGREPVYQELHWFVQPANRQTTPSGWKGLNVASVKNMDSTYHVMEYQFYNQTGWGFKVWKYGSVDSWGGREGCSEWSTLPVDRKNAFSSHEFY
ncbi:hypothetical protein AB0F25_11100 [Streptomyces wedmorensis]|uniref:hypothetical protein n=1 Tax=Streptomyces wedmorensis TaxID=43759 RepID=UPI00343090BF